jgi:hypothetical protein
MARPRRKGGMRNIPPYALASVIAFLGFLLVLVALIAYAERLTKLGLTEHVFYLVLVLMGLTSAVFLFGVFRSSATFQGNLLGGTLRLGGPVVGAGLVVVGGYFFIPIATTFPLTVYVHGEAGPQDIVLRGSGRVFLKLGPEIVPEPIGENGQAFYPAIPASFRGQQVPAWVESEGYASAENTIKLDGPGIDLTVKKIIRSYKLAGTVLDSKGNPLPGVDVALPHYKLRSSTDRDGSFEFEVTIESEQPVDLVAQKLGYQTVRLSPTLGDAGVNFSMERSQ